MKNIYEVYMKDSSPDGENKNYRKKININKFIDAFYDEEVKVVFVVGLKTIHTIRNDSNNNFTITSSLSLEGYPDITNAKYNSNTK